MLNLKSMVFCIRYLYPWSLGRNIFPVVFFWVFRVFSLGPDAFFGFDVFSRDLLLAC